MYPVLFAPDATSWLSFGIGVLSDAISCEVEETRNGPYELEMTYPITGVFYDQIALRCLIVAKPNYTDEHQPFRIYNITKPMNGVVTISARHISYDLSGYIDEPFSAIGIQDAIVKMVNDSVYPDDCPFSIVSDMSKVKPMVVAHPESVRALMGGVEGSLIDTYGGEWHFDRYDCILNAARGENRGVIIRYGKNLTDIRQEENNASVYTAVYPYYYNQDTDTLVVLPEKIVQAPGTFSFSRILKLDMTNDFQEPPTEQQLRSAAESYISSRSIGVPDVNLTISFIEADSMQERVDLCDTVTVVFDRLGVSTSAKCIRTKWDVLKGRYIEAELGSVRASLTETIARSSEIGQVIDEYSSQFQTVARSIASVVTGNTGGYIVLHDVDNDGKPDEILIMDDDDIDQAVNVIRINNSGIAFSKTGYHGTYTTAWNINGEFSANFIASGQIQTQSVKILGDSNFYWDSNNITLVDPHNPSRVIRFGRYDGQNYGLAFSVDGGISWVSGLDFTGLRLVTPGSSGTVELKNNHFFIDNTNGVTIARLGSGACVNDRFAPTESEYYQLGTTTSSTRSNPSTHWTWAEAHGEGSFNAGRYSLPRGAFSVCVGYSNEALCRYAVALGYKNNSWGAGGVAIGEENTCDFIQHTDPDAYPNGFVSGVAIGYKNHSYKSGSVAIGMECESQHAGAVCIGDKLISGKDNQFVIGSKNRVSSSAYFLIGAGVSTFDPDTGEETITRANSLEFDGNMYIYGSYLNFSDKRFKDVVGTPPEDVKHIRAVRFVWNEKNLCRDEQEHIGYIAQDVEAVAPYLVRTDQDGYKSLDYTGLLCAKVDQLERTVEQLTARIAELEARLQ